MRILFYKSHWINRLLTRSRYGHCSIQLDSGLLLNCSRIPELVGVLDEYPEQPAAYYEFIGYKENITRAIEYCQVPLTLKRIFKRNCVRCAALAIYGCEEMYGQIRTLQQASARIDARSNLKASE